MVTKEQALEILDRLEFFQGQRAGRELWNEKNRQLQDIDIACFVRDISALREYITNGSEWVSVDDKNPEDVYGKDREKITVLVCTKSGKVSASTRCARYAYDYKQNKWVRTGEYEWSGSKRVTHWRPMPDPPRQQDDRQERIET